MLDIKLIRERPEVVRDALTKRGGRYLPDLDQVIEKDKSWREILLELEALRTQRNKLSEEIGLLKREKKNADELMKQVDIIKTGMKEKEEQEATLKNHVEMMLMGLPNLPHESVVVGKSADDNKVVREHGVKPAFGFKPKDHHELGTSLGILDFESATQLSGARFALFMGAGARLERAIANFMLDLHTKEHGYTEVLPPYLVSSRSMTNTGQLPKFADELYKCSEDDLYLIPTSEVSLTNLLQQQTLEEKDLPRAVTALTPCFRREAGTYGKDTRGLIRNHQFDKVELVRFCRIEDSMEQLEVLTKHAEEVLKRLELPYRVLALCSGDMGFSSTKTYDLEVWLPGENTYREISSCSSCSDFQARRMNFKVVKEKKRDFGCTLNGSGLAVGRTWAAVMENGQQADGSIKIPKVLQPYFGSDIIERKK
jgi:seryl-tRNA synthetase